jgi:hypothetical protein
MLRVLLGMLVKFDNGISVLKSPVHWKKGVFSAGNVDEHGVKNSLLQLLVRNFVVQKPVEIQ